MTRAVADTESFHVAERAVSGQLYMGTDSGLVPVYITGEQSFVAATNVTESPSVGMPEGLRTVVDEVLEGGVPDVDLSSLPDEPVAGGMTEDFIVTLSIFSHSLSIIMLCH